MKTLYFILFISFILGCNSSSKILGERLIYDVAFAEWQGKSMGAKVEVLIRGDSIFVRSYHGLSLEKGELIDSGILIKHKSGKWIIAQSVNDKYADEIGGCSDGPSVIDLENKKYWLC